MNALEDRLREALADRAAHSPIDPDAWDKTVARSRRLRPSLPGWLPAGLVIPAAAAAAVVAVVLAAVTLTGGTHRAAPAAGTTTPPPPGTPRQVTGVLRAHPAVTAIVSAKLGGTRVYAWFSDLRDGYGCAVVLGTPTSSGGFSCGRWTSGPSDVDGSAVSTGRASQRATSVTARLNDGTPAPAVVLTGRGFPFRVWFVTIPEGYYALLTFFDAAHDEVQWLPDNVQVQQGASIPGSGGITVDGWAAYLANGKVLWHGPHGGAIVPLPWTVKQKPLLVLYQETTTTNYALGYTRTDVARLVLRMPDGHEYGGPTVPGWPGSGVRLWVRSGLPSGGLPAATVVISYNAAGKVIAQHAVSALLNG
jgi:hypothetical protein